MQYLVSVIDDRTGSGTPEEMTATLADVDDVRTALHELARRHLASVTRPQVVRLRRLSSAESGRSATSWTIRVSAASGHITCARIGTPARSRSPWRLTVNEKTAAFVAA